MQLHSAGRSAGWLLNLAETAGFLFPYALLSWASLCYGGLRAAFQENEGRNNITLSVPNSGTCKMSLLPHSIG